MRVESPAGALLIPNGECTDGRALTSLIGTFRRSEAAVLNKNQKESSACSDALP